MAKKIVWCVIVVSVAGILFLIAKPNLLSRRRQTQSTTYPANAQYADIQAGFLDNTVTGPMPPMYVQEVSPQPEASNTEHYTDYGINQMVDTHQDQLSTFAIDVDTASYTIARRKLNEGQLPPPESVRVEEFINYFSYNYPQPETEHPFSLTLEAAHSPFNPKRHLMRVGIQGKTIPVAQRPEAHLTFLVDTSGSMQSDDKLGLVKQSLHILVQHLKLGDIVALTTYAGGVATVLTPTGIEHKDTILQAIDQLQAGGSTAMASGIDLAYRQAHASFKPKAINRIIICSDGDANVGNTSPDAILDTIAGYVQEGITVSAIGFGMGNYKDTMMERFANKGNGNYYYIDNRRQAERVFGEQLTSTLQVIAKDVKIQVEFNPNVVSRYRLIGYENRNVADQDFRNDQVDGGEIGAGHQVTALYELELTQHPTGRLASVHLRYKQPDGAVATEVSAEYQAERIMPDVRLASEDFRFAIAVAGFGEILRKSAEATSWSPETIAWLAQETSPVYNTERQEFLSLVTKAQEID
ncbi:MAG: von Willebrand factor type A domain-containing protein [Acidobacteria bacterium]|nr:von Willebrand factor type A domain-containing protein [Acidobacteriota bacterium]